MKLTKLALHIILCIQITIPSYAGETEDYIVESVARAAAESYVTDYVEDYIREQVNQAAAENFTNLPPDLGGDIIAYYKLVRNIKRYDEAEDGDFKTLAAANVIADVVTLVNAPIGAIIKAVLMVVGVFLAAAMMSFQKKRFEIFADAMEEYKKLIQVNMLQAKAEAARLSSLFELANTSIQKANIYKKYIQEKCTDGDKINKPVVLYSCLKSAEGLLIYKDIYIEQLSKLLEIELRFIPILETLEVMELSIDSVRQRVTEYRQQLQQMRKKVAKQSNQMIKTYLINSYSQAMTAVQRDFRQAFLADCNRKVKGYLKDVGSYLLKNIKDGAKSDSSSYKQRLIDIGDSSSFGLCKHHLKISNDQNYQRLIELFEQQMTLLRNFTPAQYQEVVL